MSLWGDNVCEFQEGFTGGSTDQGEFSTSQDYIQFASCGGPDFTPTGNVSYAVPTLHAYFGIPAAFGVQVHSLEFANAAGTAEAFAAAVRVGKALSLVGWEILTDDDLFRQCVADFELDKTLRGCA